MNPPNSILIVNLVVTMFMVGLIWMVQVVHYPLFDDLGEQDYVSYQQRHQLKITYLVGPAMLLELVTALLMIWWPAEGVSISLVYTGVGLIGVIWISTALVQVPCHEQLVKGFDLDAYRCLVKWNWVRTFAWTARGALVTWMLVRVLGD